MKTSDEIYSEMKAAYERETGLGLAAGGDMELRLRASAAQLEALWAQADFTERQSFPQTAVGLYLDRHAEVRGLKRRGAVKATGTIRFYIPSQRSAALVIPAGVVCVTAAETAFVTTAAAVVAIGSLFADAPAEASLPGSSGNAPADGVCYMQQAPTGVSRCGNPAAFFGGADAESDDSLRKRVLQSYRSLPNGANAAYYEARARDTDGVAAVSVLPKRRGVGTVDVVIASPTGQPSAALVSAVKAKLDAEREICVDIAVSAPRAVGVSVTAALKPKAGQSFAALKTEAEAAIAAYFTGERLGESVLRARLAELLWSVPGVANYSISVPAADVAIAADSLPVKGSVTITEMS
ncbi:MAG: baseplate J/gp47 family protein [Oscillospiraceae bacterium]